MTLTSTPCNASHVLKSVFVAVASPGTGTKSIMSVLTSRILRVTALALPRTESAGWATRCECEPGRIQIPDSRSRDHQRGREGGRELTKSKLVSYDDVFIKNEE